MRIMGRHGANPGERERPQAFDVDVDLELDLERSSHTDDLADTLDYVHVHRTVEQVVKEESYSLLERLAQEIVRRLLQYEHVHAATVTVAKPQLLSGATPSVTLRRIR